MNVRLLLRASGCAFLLLGTTLAAASASLVILHTNDLHDHVRADAAGERGLPYVSGYIRQVRSERKDVLVLDAGDSTDKGDLVAFKSGGLLAYELMRRIGYDAVTPGNHEEEAGRERLHRYEEALGQPFLNLNLLRPDGTPEFAASRIVEIGGLRVGIIGAIVPRKRDCLDFDATGEAIARESERLKAQAGLVVVICHERSPNCARWSRMAPAVNVFISGHSHEILHSPVIVPETGALIVQTGCYARYVGRLELEVDPDARRIVRSKGWLVPMGRATAPVDAAMAALVREREKALCPDAGDPVFENPSTLNHFEVARLATEGMRLAGSAEIAFCHPGQILRDQLPAGPIDVNALYKTGAERGHVLVLAQLTGAEIERYVNALQFQRREPPEWSGFRIRRERGPDGAERWRADLEPGRSYRVAMPRFEWLGRFVELVSRGSGPWPEPAVATVTYTQALQAVVSQTLAQRSTVAAKAAQLARDRER